MQLISSDGKILPINKSFIKMSKFLSGIEDDIDINIDCSYEVLEYIAQFCDNYETTPRICNLSNDQILEVISTTNYLDIPILLELACEQCARNIKNKSAEQIVQLYTSDKYVTKNI
jgi:hypothetical protein